VYSGQIVQQFNDIESYWNGMVELDYADFMAAKDDLRLAFHLASTLFHVHDWIWMKQDMVIRAQFGIVHNGPLENGVRAFSEVLARMDLDFERIRAVANAGKHLSLKKRSSNANVGFHAANTATSSSGYGTGGYGTGNYGTPRTYVVLEGEAGKPTVYFHNVAERIYRLWKALIVSHGWAAI
jgi:hypothetical protein